jgi:hypothetical protein
MWRFGVQPNFETDIQPSFENDMQPNFETGTQPSSEIDPWSCQSLMVALI